MTGLSSASWRRRLGWPSFPALAAAAAWLALAAGVLTDLPRLPPPLDPPAEGSPAGAEATPGAAPLPNTDVNPFGANFFLEWEPESWKVEKTLQMAREAGLGWVKQQFPWEDIQLAPGPDGYWDHRLNKSTWEKYDRIVDLARKHGLEVIARLDRPPKWTRQDNRLPSAPPDRFEDYGDFVHTLASRYRGRVRYYQVWNEPNVYPEWGERAPDPAGYVRLLTIAAARIREADPDAWILSAPLAQTLEESERNLSELVYLDRMYQAGAGEQFDVLFANAYGFAFPPDDPPRPDRLNFARALLLRRVMERHGDGQKAVWFNEFGWNAAPEDFPPERLPWARVSEPAQASYTVQAIEQARAAWPWAGVFNVWYFRQAGQYPPDRPEYYFRMVDPGFTARPLYHAVRRAASAVGVAGPGRHEESSPAVVRAGAWRSERRSAASGGAVAVSRQPGDSLTLTFRGGDVSLLAQSGSTSGMLYVTLDGREANRLPRDNQGRSYLELYAPGVSVLGWVPIADELGGETHVLRMVVGASQNPEAKGNNAVAVDGFRVGEGAAATPGRWLRLGALAAATLLVGWLAWRAGRRPPSASRGETASSAGPAGDEGRG